MKTEKFNYDLPEHLIAQYPLENRVDSRLLACIDGIEHKKFSRCTLLHAAWRFIGSK